MLKIDKTSVRYLKRGGERIRCHIVFPSSAFANIFLFVFHHFWSSHLSVEWEDSLNWFVYSKAPIFIRQEVYANMSLFACEEFVPK